jgi:hypothetical protein
MYSTRGKTPSITTQITKSNINTLLFLCGKTLVGSIHGPNQHDHLEKFINAKEKITRELQENLSQSIVRK